MGYWKFLDTASAEKDFEDDYNVIVQNAFGVGMPTHHNVITPFGLVDGGVFQRTIIPPRVFTLQCATKTTTIDAWHTAREDLFDQLKRDRAGTVSPVTIRYDDGTTTLDIAAYYDGGLEIGTLEKTIEKFAIRFVCADPFWKASSTSSTSLNLRSTIANESFVYRDSDGLWNSDGPAQTTGAIMSFGEKSNGNIIIAGHNENIYEWNGSTFSDIGTISANGNVYGVAVDAADNVFIVGDFTTVDAVTARRIAKWNGSAWSEPATNGFNGIVWDIAIDNNGDYVVGGEFTQDGSPAGTYRRAALVTASSGAITELASGLNSTVYAIQVDPDNNYYFGGLFQSDGASAGTYRRLAYYNGSAWVEVDTGLGSGCLGIHYAKDINVFYVNGNFTTDGPGTKTLTRLVKVVNNKTFDLNSSFDTGHDELGVDTNNVLYLGDLTNFTLHSLRGGVIVREDIQSTARFDSVFVDSSDRVWVSVDTLTETFTVAGRTTVNNTGTAEAFPTIAITGPGACHILRNYTSNKALYFDGLTLQSSEILTIDLSPGVKTITSSLRGNMIHFLHHPSDLATFSLLPGNNNISLLVDDATASATITWTGTYWSIDGVT